MADTDTVPATEGEVAEPPVEQSPEQAPVDDKVEQLNCEAGGMDAEVTGAGDNPPTCADDEHEKPQQSVEDNDCENKGQDEAKKQKAKSGTCVILWTT